MAKSTPAFQFYPADFLGGTAMLSAEETGAYVRLLCHQWISAKPLPSSHKKLATLSGLDSKTFERVWQEISDKFKRDDSGYYNERLEETRYDQKKKSEQGKKAAEKRWMLEDSKVVNLRGDSHE